MAEKTEIVCGSCGSQTVLFCDNMFTDFVCTTCGATNLGCSLRKIETEIECKDGEQHDIRIAKNNILFCVKCRSEIGKLVLQNTKVTEGSPK